MSAARSRSTAASVATATAVALALPIALFLARFDSVEAAMRSIDFTDGLFEDFLGPYWRSAEAVAEGRPAPDAQYLYPPALAVLLSLLVPLGSAGASWAAALAGVFGTAALCGAALLVRPARTRALGPVLLGASVGLSFPVVHGAAWGNASLPVLGAAALGWALALRERHAAGGVLLGAACAIKPTPLLALLGLVAIKKRRATAWACAALFIVGALFPALALGVDGALAFARESFGHLARLREHIAGAAGAPGSQDLASSLQRLAEGALPRRVAVLLGGAVLAGVAVLGRRAIRTPGAKRSALVAPLLAFPTLLVLPSWPHALAWIPLAAWAAWPVGAGLVRRVLVVLAAALSSLPAAWLFPSPADHIGSGILPLAGLLALVALLTPGARGAPGAAGPSADEAPRP